MPEKDAKDNGAGTLKFLFNQCEGTDPFYCIPLSIIDTFLNNPDAARMHLSLGCKSGDATCCVLLGDRIYSTSEEAALTTYDLACKLDDDYGCKRLGALHYRRSNFTKAYQSFKELCDRGDFVSCGLTANTLEKQGKKIEAKAMYTKACEGGHDASCLDLGKLESESGNTSAAKGYYKASCLDRRSADGCLRLGLIEKELGNNSSSKTFFGDACKLNNAEGCAHFALIELNLKNMKSAANYLKKARKLFNIDCENGNSTACERLKTFAKAGIVD